MKAGLTLTEEFAMLPAEFGLGEYLPDDVGGVFFLGSLPPDQDAGVAVHVTNGGGPANAHHGYNEPVIHYRIRGPRWDPRAAEATAWALWDTLHGLRRRDLPGGTRMLSMHGQGQGPIYAEHDDHGRYQYSAIFAAEVRRVTRNRV